MGGAKDLRFEQLLGSEERIYYPKSIQDVTNRSGINDTFFQWGIKIFIE